MVLSPAGTPPTLPGRLSEFDSSGNIARFNERAAGGMPLLVGEAAPRTVENTRMGRRKPEKAPGGAINGEAARQIMANELAKLAGFEAAPIMQASGFAGGR